MLVWNQAFVSVSQRNLPEKRTKASEHDTALVPSKEQSNCNWIKIRLFWFAICSASYNISMNKTSGHILFCCYQLNFLNCYILKAVLMLDNVRYSASMIVNFLKLS